MSLYDDLGVARDADAEEVKAAYRRRAQETHPDRRGGSAEAFKVVQAAYDVLSDPERRKRYDATGDQTPEEDLRQMAVNSIAHMALGLVDSVETLGNANVLDKLKADTWGLIRGHETLCVQLEKKIAKRERTAKRFRRKRADGQANVLALVLERDAAAKRMEIANVRKLIECGKKMLEILSEYEYDAEAKELLVPLVGMWTTGASS